MNIADSWVLGDSIVRWTGVQFNQRARQFRIDWEGYSGLRAEELHSKIQFGLLTGKTPETIFIHVGGNNITSNHACKIIRTIKREIKYIIENFESSLVVWIFILPRLSWNSSSEIDYCKKMNSKRLTINRTISNYILSFPSGRALNIKSIDTQTPGFFYQDNVHLSQVGYEMLIDAVTETLAKVKTQKYVEI